MSERFYEKVCELIEKGWYLEFARIDDDIQVIATSGSTEICISGGETRGVVDDLHNRITRPDAHADVVVVCLNCGGNGTMGSDRVELGEIRVCPICDGDGTLDMKKHNLEEDELKFVKEE